MPPRQFQFPRARTGEQLVSQTPDALPGQTAGYGESAQIVQHDDSSDDRLNFASWNEVVSTWSEANTARTVDTFAHKGSEPDLPASTMGQITKNGSMPQLLSTVGNYAYSQIVNSGSAEAMSNFSQANQLIKDVNGTEGQESTTELLFPPPGQTGVPQPDITLTDGIIIAFMFGLWAYSIYLTYRAWHKILNDSSGDYQDGKNLWRFIMEVVRNKKKHHHSGNNSRCDKDNSNPEESASLKTAEQGEVGPADEVEGQPGAMAQLGHDEAGLQLVEGHPSPFCSREEEEEDSSFMEIQALRSLDEISFASCNK